MWACMTNVVNRYKEMEKKLEEKDKLFLKDFDDTFQNQKECVLNCLKDLIIDGKVIIIIIIITIIIIIIITIITYFI